MTLKKNNKDVFSVAVIATMSSGKSTTLNAMLGLPLLPSMNEACTATVYKIEDIDGLDHIKARYITKEGCESDWEEISAQEDKLSEWNNGGFESIEIQGDFPHIDNHKNIISFLDTPGPNNSSDKSHSEITHNIIANNPFGFVLCIMNASQFGVDDERILLTNLLNDLNEKGQKTKIVFAVNKMDQLDVEGGESPKALISKIRKYLNEIGYFRPVVVPIMSLTSLEIRELIEAHKNKSELPFSSRKQKKILHTIECLFEFSTDYKDASLNTKVQNKHLEQAQKKARNIDKHETLTLAGTEISIGRLIEADIITGIPLLEEMLEIELLKNSNQLNDFKKPSVKKTTKLKAKRKKKPKIKKHKKNK
ncbi:hypothetical protein CXF85_07670 [Colwellia sp. 75C3]|uniref:dynamin family protein n=1 Tax=Colwellia sp. 75C3 TaxID=888425 RepID=UPI000C33EC79|nr:dynamin family protein [Colwellia sp. 75C3]PKG85447.1 hypothetical protein CXF85_07670 [Colwellia sp. 75C3]